jgi:hypothetical protein
VFVKVLDDCCWGLLVFFRHDWLEHLLLPDYTVAKSVELRVTVRYHLVRSLRLADQKLAISQVTTDISTNHHRKLIYCQLRGCTIVPPVVVVSPADGIELIRVLILDSVLPDFSLDLWLSVGLENLLLARNCWCSCRACVSTAANILRSLKINNNETFTLSKTVYH